MPRVSIARINGDAAGASSPRMTRQSATPQTHRKNLRCESDQLTNLLHAELKRTLPHRVEQGTLEYYRIGRAISFGLNAMPNITR